MGAGFICWGVFNLIVEWLCNILMSGYTVMADDAAFGFRMYTAALPLLPPFLMVNDIN